MLINVHCNTGLIKSMKNGLEILGMNMGFILILSVKWYILYVWKYFLAIIMLQLKIVS